MSRWPRIRRTAGASLVLAVLSSLLVVFGPASPAYADPECQPGGAYVLWARGSGQSFNDVEAQTFYENVYNNLQVRGITEIDWAELGNLDGQPGVDANGYPAVPIPWSIPTGAYDNSVTTGRNELVTHLNDRYAGDGPKNTGSCNSEVLVLGGYSQGAEVIGRALQGGLSQAVKDHVGYIALYGDPRFNPGLIGDRQNRVNFQSAWWWVRGNDPGYHGNTIHSGIRGAYDPYAPIEFRGRLGSWCDSGDGLCTGLDIRGGNHGYAYEGPDRWIADGAEKEIGWAVAHKRNALNPTLLPATTGYYSPPDSVAGPPVAPPPPIIKQIKRKTDHAGIYQVYAATPQAVTEAWWHPGQGVQTKEMIHISQGNIVGFDKVNEPDGTTQSLYTAVPDGVWETWWRPGDGPHSTKIVTGLTGVRQVIADPVTDGGQYTHRLYVLAQDGPYEVWWREGGDGIHVNRLDIVNDPVTMTKSRGPDGTDQLYVATPTWVYELWWRPNTGVNHGSVINITQGDIRSLDKGANLPDGGQLLYTGTSTTGWQTYWNSANGTGISHGTIATGQSNAIQIKKTVYDGTHQLYLATGDHVQEYWWNGPNSGTSELIRISQSNITSFDKSADGPDQQLYTASGDLVYETWWRGGSNPSGPNTSVLFKVAR